jgi:muramoyltetrapeptide carboxypeptidase LdcA involved in peptidoglycan recycling
LLRTRTGGRPAPAFADPDIAGVVSTIAGDDSIRLLRHLDLDLLADNPKVFLGYSDSTITQMAMLRAGVTSFYGPAIMAGFAENAGLHDYLVEGVRRTLFEPTASLEWPENRDGWTVEFLDWSDPANQQRRRELRPSTGWRWHGGIAREGTTVGGCLEVLDFLWGTMWWPPLDEAVLSLETSEDQPPPVSVIYLLRSLAATGELHRLAGIVVGRSVARTWGLPTPATTTGPSWAWSETRRACTSSRW